MYTVNIITCTVILQFEFTVYIWTCIVLLQILIEIIPLNHTLVSIRWYRSRCILFQSIQIISINIRLFWKTITIAKPKQHQASSIKLTWDPYKPKHNGLYYKCKQKRVSKSQKESYSKSKNKVKSFEIIQSITYFQLLLVLQVQLFLVLQVQLFLHQALSKEVNRMAMQIILTDHLIVLLHFEYNQMVLNLTV